MAIPSKILIREATLLTMDPLLGVQENSNVLIEGDRIVSISKDVLSLSGGDVKIIDGTDCIVTPGFIDGHHHMWQQLLRALTVDWSLFEYFLNVRLKYGSVYTASDVYFAQYAAALDLLNNGVTCVLDHSHVMNSPAHSDAAVKGLRDAGIRGTFCYGFYANPENVVGSQVAEGWDQAARERDAERIRAEFGKNDPEIQVLTFGVAPNEAQTLPIEHQVKEIEFCRKIGARIITNHIARGNADSTGAPIIQKLGEMGWLGPDLLYSHAGGCSDEELDAITKAGAAVCATPDTETQMGMGGKKYPWPVCWRASDHGCKTCLGLDITSNQGNDFLAQMRLALQCQRAVEAEGLFPLKVHRKAEEVLKLGTAEGARAMGLDHLIGSITPGKRADLVVWKCDDISTVPYVDPVGELLFHASPRNIDTVIVNGNIVKENGQLRGLDWPKLRQELQTRSRRIVEAAGRINTGEFATTLEKLYAQALDMENSKI